MPRTTRSFGRPGTPVIPKDWEGSHAPVVEKTFTAECRIWAPTSSPTVNDDLSYDLPDGLEVEPVYAGGCRIQVLNVGDSSRIFGEEYQATSGYLVVIGADADSTIDRGAVVEVTSCADPSLIEDGRRLVVARVDRGSLRWERDLYCVDTVTTPTTS